MAIGVSVHETNPPAWMLELLGGLSNLGDGLSDIASELLHGTYVCAQSKTRLEKSQLCGRGMPMKQLYLADTNTRAFGRMCCDWFTSAHNVKSLLLRYTW